MTVTPEYNDFVWTKTSDKTAEILGGFCPKFKIDFPERSSWIGLKLGAMLSLLKNISLMVAVGDQNLHSLGQFGTIFPLLLYNREGCM